ncbi:hypothetical protein EXT53_19270 [Pectobacterium polaris]|uniref:Uncharacterized protein n=1 Tax=Pectobacterium polaris TaxID=2042057 RepID=A0AAW5GLB3_9GAMM|nr:hypothetical protein [Pectobacterium polaris]
MMKPNGTGLVEHNKFMQYGRGLGLWRNPRENIKPETDNCTPIREDTTLRVVSEVVSGIGKISPYSGGTVGGLLEGMHDVNK